MTLDFYALWTLSGLGTVVFSALAPATRTARAALAASFVGLSAVGAYTGVPSAQAAGLMVALGAALLLLRPGTPIAAAVVAGGSAGIWGVMLSAQGPPIWAGAGLAAVGLGTAMTWARRPTFAPPRMREEALFVLMVCAVATAMVPGVQDGWRAAVNLSLQSSPPAAATAVPTWALAVGVSAVTLGALYSLWSRR
jgi:hypothetical protein